MPDTYKVEATVISLGDMEQVNFTDKKTGRPSSFIKFTAECQVGSESHTYEARDFHRKRLTVGGYYSLEIMPSDYAHNIWKIEPIEAPSGHLVKAAEAMGVVFTEETPTPPVAPPSNGNPTPQPQNRPIPPQNANQGISQGPPLRPDLKERSIQYNTHARTAQMQATERVRMFVDLAIAGKLLNDEGEPVDKLRKSTVEGWLSDHIDFYWAELEVRIQKDAYGDLTEVRNASS